MRSLFVRLVLFFRRVLPLNLPWVSLHKSFVKVRFANPYLVVSRALLLAVVPLKTDRRCARLALGSIYSIGPHCHI